MPYNLLLKISATFVIIEHNAVHTPYIIINENANILGDANIY